MKAQISAEFLVVLSGLLVIFAIVFGMYSGQNTIFLQAQNAIGASNNAYQISAVLNYVHLAGDGASYNLTVSGKENNESITISDGQVESSKTRAKAQAPILNSNVNTSALNSKQYIVENKNGGIEIG